MNISTPAGLNPDILKTFRESLGMTQRAFAKEAMTTAALISRYETGLTVASVDFLKKLENHFGIPGDYFTQTVELGTNGLVHHRKRQALGVKLRTQIEAQGWLRLFDAIKVARESHINADLPRTSEKAPELLSAEIRRLWNLGDKPIDNIIALLERHGIFVLPFDFGTEQMDAFFMSSVSGVYVIAVNTAFLAVPDRMAFSIAHELGHVLMHADEFPDEKCEKEANDFASAFLMPPSMTDELKIGVTSMSAMSAIKFKWHVSIAALLKRAKSLGVLSEDRYKGLVIWMSSNGYRTREPLCGLRPLPPPRLFADTLEKSCGSPESASAFLKLSDEAFKKRYPFFAGRRPPASADPA